MSSPACVLAVGVGAVVGPGERVRVDRCARTVIGHG